ncbi:MAG TPA: beta-ketoacyl synthase N-terminal-like domain-containing protein [Longimicrobiaceae bacterium]
MSGLSGRGRRAALTGMGVVTPVGVGVPDFLEALRMGRQALRRVEGFPTPRGKGEAGIVEDTAFAGPDRAFRMARRAALEALRGARWVGSGRLALLLSTIAGDTRAAEEAFAGLDAGSAGSGAEEALRMYPSGHLLHRLGDEVGALGPRLAVTNACASGNIAIGLALDLLRDGTCEAALIVGVEVLKPTMVWGADRAGFAGRALRPFHPLRDGSILGEGAGALLLESAASADGVELGWIEGFGCVADRGAAAITLLEDGSGLERSMTAALDDAGRGASEVEYVSAHAPGTRGIDRIECMAIARLCGARTREVAVNATKSVTTHLGGASAVVEVVATLLQMRDGFVHPTVGLDQPDPDLALRPVGAAGTVRQVTRALSNACGGGGLNTSLVVTAGAEPPGEVVAAEAREPAPVVVTGVGCLCRLGFGSEELFAEDRVAPADTTRELSWFDVERWSDPAQNFAFMNRAAQLAVAAAALAVRNARLDLGGKVYAPDRVAGVAGTYLGGGPEASAVLCRGLLRNPEHIRPSMTLDHGVHLGAALIGRHFDLTGPTYTLTGTRVAGLQALAVAAALLRSGRADAAVVVGFDTLAAIPAAGLPLLMECVGRTDLCEGAGAVVLEREPGASARGAEPRLEVGSAVHFSIASRAVHPTPPLADRLRAALGARPEGAVSLAGDAAPTIRAAAASLGQGDPVDMREQTGCSLAADGLFAVVGAVGQSASTLVFGAERSGAVSAIQFRPAASPGIREAELGIRSELQRT